MYDLYSMEVMMKDRRREIMNEVRTNQMIKAAKTERKKATPRIGERIAARIGNSLIAAGEKLKSRRQYMKTVDACVPSEQKACA